MSYIRSTSNPESLYIWGDLDQNAYVVMGPDNIGTMPTRTLNGLIKKYVRKDDDEPCRYSGAEIKEVNIDGEFKMELSYKDKWKCHMWRVTWEYVVLTNYIRLDLEEFRAKKDYKKRMQEGKYFKKKNFFKKLNTEAKKRNPLGDLRKTKVCIGRISELTDKKYEKIKEAVEKGSKTGTKGGKKKTGG